MSSSLTPVKSSTCPFCALSKQQVILETPTVLATFDRYPISEGHTLVIPKRHIAHLFELPEGELRAAWSLVAKVRILLKAKYHPDGFNIGVNEGAAAGQTIGHAHIHIIPRYKGDVHDPRGGIRWVIPANAKYW